MLILSRKVDEAINIGDDIVVTVVSVNGDKVRLGVKAPKETLVLRTELATASGAPSPKSQTKPKK